MPSHPYAWLDEASQRRALPLLCGAAIAVTLAMAVLGEPLRSDAAPQGILDFEFARTLPRARAILASWSPEAKLYAALGLGVDYLFLVAYSAAICLACVRAAAGLESRSPALARLGRRIAWAIPLAGVCDACENFALIRLLLGDERGAWAALAHAAALPKFAIVGVGLLYALVGGIAIAARRFRAG